MLFCIMFYIVIEKHTVVEWEMQSTSGNIRTVPL
jgi:hypothetical protein